MTTASGKLSVPDHLRRPPREPTAAERAALGAVADALIPPKEGFGPPTAVPGFDRWLDRALAARSDSLEAVLAAALPFAELPAAERLPALEEYSEADPEGFHLLSAIVAGAYLMIPEVRRAIGYPGQVSHPARFDEAAEQIMDGILDPVIERGAAYTPAPRDPAPTEAKG
jgi:hypothetical protein